MLLWDFLGDINRITDQLHFTSQGQQTLNLIDPQVSLAFAIHSNAGAYAALIGSGVSVGGGIPAGWQVTLDLISIIARLEVCYA